MPTGTNNRYQNFYWNGEELELKDIKGTTDDAQVDLSLVDPQQMVDLLNTVRGRIENPDNWYVIIGDSFGSGPQISCLRVQRLRRVHLHHRDPRRHGRLRLRGSVAATQRVPGRHEPPGHPVVVMGVSGSGKSTVGAALAGRLGSPSRTATTCTRQPTSTKMARGEPLDDGDRWPWLERVGEWLAEHADGGVIACSALKRSVPRPAAPPLPDR